MRFDRSIKTALVAAATAAGSAPALAADADWMAVPGEELGVWATGGCEAPSLTLARSRLGALLIEADGAELVLAQPLERSGEWLVSRTPDGLAFSRLIGERLEVASASRTAPGGGGPPADADVVVLERCDALPPPLSLEHGLGVAMLGAADGVLEHCVAGGLGFAEGACAEAILAGADVSGDRELGSAELSRVARGLAYLGVVASESGDLETLAAASALGSLIAPFASWSIIQNADYDGSGALSLEELTQDMGGLDFEALLALGEVDFEALFEELEPLLEQLE